MPNLSCSRIEQGACEIGLGVCSLYKQMDFLCNLGHILGFLVISTSWNMTLVIMLSSCTSDTPLLYKT